MGNNYSLNNCLGSLCIFLPDKKMSFTKVLIYTGLMAGITYLIRMLPLTLFRKEIKSNFINSFFSYIPYAVLGAMTFPNILYSTDSLWSAVAGLFVAVFLAFKNKSMLLVSLAACFTVFAVEKILIII